MVEVHIFHGGLSNFGFMCLRREMEDQGSIDPYLDMLRKLSLLDERLTRVLAERKGALEKLDVLKKRSKEARSRRDQSRSLYENLKLRYDAEEREIEAEQKGLESRRRALSTFSNYKVHQSASAEVERARKLLEARQDSLLLSLEQLESFEKELERSSSDYSEAKTVYDGFLDESKQLFGRLEERYLKALNERSLTVESVPERILNDYEVVRARYPLDPIVAVVNQQCQGCFVTVPPQAMVDLAGRTKLIRCRGCRRILYLPDQAEGGE